MRCENEFKCRVIDMSNDVGGTSSISYKEKDLVFAAIKGDYLVTNYLVRGESILELRKISSKPNTSSMTSSLDYISHNLNSSQEL